MRLPIDKSSKTYLFIFLIAALLFFGCDDSSKSDGEPLGDQTTEQDRSGETDKCDIELIIVPADNPMLVTVMTPVLAKLGQGGSYPQLVAVSESLYPETSALIRHFDPAEKMLVSAKGQKPDLNQVSGSDQISTLKTSSRPVYDSILIAKRFWQQSEKVVLVDSDDYEAVILGSALAAHQAIPLIVYEGSQDQAELTEIFDKLEVDKIILALTDDQKRHYWLKNLGPDIKFLESFNLQDELVASIGREEAPAIVLSRTPNDLAVNNTAWLAPYYSLVRKAPLVMARSSDAVKATSSVMDLISRHKLSPRSLTILADCESIGKQSVKIFDTQDEGKDHTEKTSQEASEPVAYTLEVEPGMPDNFDQIPSFAVGRIPSETLEEAATFLTRGFVREQLLADSKPKSMIVANVAAETRGLPLSETMARLSVGEFQNVELSVEAFYGDSARKDAAKDKARQANLIIYHGHTGYEDFLPEAVSQPSENMVVEYEGEPNDQEYYYDYDHYENHYDDEYYRDTYSHPEGRAPYDSGDRDTPEDGADDANQGVSRTNSATDENLSKQTLNRGSKTEDSSEQLEGLPVVVLQSCSSLGDRFMNRIHPFGGVAKIGTVTAMHSASGTAFIKAWADGILYRNARLGEALRDARIFFFLLQELKDSRGHTKQPKSQRAALSFQLWGDPELRVFPQGIGKPRLEPASISSAGTDSADLSLTIPSHRKDEVHTDDYFAQHLPDTQVAGIVMRRGSKDARRVAPIHFFRIPLPADLEEKQSGNLYPVNDEPAEVFYSVDRFQRYLYMLYYPEEKEYWQDKVHLEFSAEDEKNVKK